MQRISKHITYGEAIRSDVARKNNITNYFTEPQLWRMQRLAEEVFEPLRKYFDVPIFVSSFFRNKKVNELTGGTSDSQHMANNGAAIDIDSSVYGGVSNKQLFEYIKNYLKFDQLIWELGTKNEPNWVHVSYVDPALDNGDENRQQVLISKIGKDGKTEYGEFKG